MVTLQGAVRRFAPSSALSCTRWRRNDGTPLLNLPRTGSTATGAVCWKSLPHDELRAGLAQGRYADVLAQLDRLKQARAPSPDAGGEHPLFLPNLDYYRAQVFLHRDNDMLHARQALLEELRLFSEFLRQAVAAGTPVGLQERENARRAQRQLLEINEAARPLLLPPKEVEREHPLFFMLADALIDHTMLSWPRLFALYTHACHVLYASASEPSHRLSRTFENAYNAPAGAVEGDFVECGTAGGGASVMLAVLLAHYDAAAGSSPGMQRPRRFRKVFACDSYAGMPEPSDVHDYLEQEGAGASRGVTANATSWGAGTCASPAEHVRQLARNFGVEDRLVVVPGLFSHSLPCLTSSDAELESEPRCQQIALLHADADWYHSTHCVLDHLWQRVTPGGVVQVDDYHYWRGCRTAVDEFLAAHCAHDGAIAPPAHEIDGNAVFFVKPSHMRA